MKKICVFLIISLFSLALSAGVIRLSCTDVGGPDRAYFENDVDFAEYVNALEETVCGAD